MVRVIGTAEDVEDCVQEIIGGVLPFRLVIDRNFIERQRSTLSVVPHHPTVAAAKLRSYSQMLGCDTLHGIGFQARCPCGWRGKVRAAHRVARQDGRQHVADAAHPETVPPHADG